MSKKQYYVIFDKDNNGNYILRNKIDLSEEIRTPYELQKSINNKFNILSVDSYLLNKNKNDELLIKINNNENKN